MAAERYALAYILNERVATTANNNSTVEAHLDEAIPSGHAES
jgi:hypothetical protein